MIIPSPPSAPAGEQSSDRWFSDHVHVHDSALKSYLHRSFPSARHEVDDVVQESYLRIWRTRTGQPLASAKAFLFKVARNVVLDFLRRTQISPIEAVGDLETLSVSGEGQNVAEIVGQEEKIRFLIEGLAQLPPRGREVVMLRKFKGLSQLEVAAQLGISEKTVDEHLARSVRRLGIYLRARGVSRYYEP